jgi:hypothetical protein
MKRRIPYLSYTTFNNFIKSLAANGVPTRIDRDTLKHKSGSTHSMLRSALYYLRLIDAEGVPTETLKHLVEAKGVDQQAIWKTILRRSYAGAFALNLEKATTEELREALASEGVRNEDTIRKAINFFCLAAKAAGLNISNHIQPYAGRQAWRRRSSQRTQEKESEQRDFVSIQPDFAPSVTKGFTDIQLLLSKFPQYDHNWSDERIDKWVRTFKKLYGILRDNQERTEKLPFGE